MKKISLILVALIFTSLAFAQQHQGQHQGHGKGNHETKTPEQKAEAATKKWTNILTLTPEQQPKVKQILLDKANKVEAIKTKYKSSADKDKKAAHEEIKTVRTETDNSMKQVLTPEQYDKYIKTKEEQKKKKEQEKQKQKGQPSQAPADDEDDD